VHAANHV